MAYDRLGRGSGFLALALLAASACSIAPGATRPITPAADTACHQMSFAASQLPETIGNLSADATDIVIGVFGGYGQPEWNTPDGHRPSPEEVQQTSARLIRPLAIDLTAQIRGDKKAAKHAVVRGGAVGCDVISYGDDPALNVGQRYVFFLLAVLNSELEPSDDFMVIAAWPVDQADVVTTSHEGKKSLDEVKRSIEEGPKPPETPNPNEPWPSGPG